MTPGYYLCMNVGLDKKYLQGVILSPDITHERGTNVEKILRFRFRASTQNRDFARTVDCCMRSDT